MRLPLAFALTLTLAAALQAQPPHLVALTGPLTPAEERKALTLPPGFDIQLVAAEPDIQKPMQLAFDAKGRIWVTTSYHYPFAAEKGKATDKLFVLSDFGPDGKARKVQTFAADLNIPIGILPLPDCNSCIVSSVGEILKLTDTDGDGKADRREVLFTGFGSRDTHGMYNSYIQMPDGWVYACHGFANDSTVKGKDGHEVKMQSGHTFRFRPDGSRIEIFTRGQVNPFGMCIDPYFNFYTADCHSKPITQLIPGAYYDSFGKPHDGLGFAPHVTPHDHGSTGLCGVTWYDADHFPKQYLGCMFVGNVVTNRINFDKIEWRGATPVAKELPDFVTSKDPWFRPVDIKLGPDGALYVSDFYNKIIGHYEVDLKHPGRDKDRGRIWRIVWTGTGEREGAAAAPAKPYTDLTTDKVEKLDDLLGHPNLTVRMQATNMLIHRGGLAHAHEKESEVYTAHRLWVDEVLAWKNNTQLKRADSGRVRPLVAVHEYRVRKAHHEWEREHKTKDELKTALPDLAAADPRVARSVAEMMAADPQPEYVKPLVALIQKVPANDVTLRHAARIALRNCLRDGNAECWAAANKLGKGAAPVLADVVLAVPGQAASSFLADCLKTGTIPDARLAEVAAHIGRHGGFEDRTTLIVHVTEWNQGAAKAAAVLQALARGVQSQGSRLGNGHSTRLLKWARAIVQSGDSEARVSALRLLTDLSPLFRDDLQFRGDEELDPVPAVAGVVADSKLSDDLRGVAADACVKLNPAVGYTKTEGLIDNAGTSPTLRERAALILASSADRNHKQAAKDAINAVPYRSAVVIATALAGSKVGGDVLLDGVKQGKAPARLLQEKGILDRLRAANVENLNKRVADLTKGLPPADQKLAALIKDRTGRFASVKPDRAEGAKLFAKHCGACHRIGEQGGKVGPQLDGVGIRGLERLLEDTLDPNRNVDAAFRARVLNLADGTQKTGLMLRVEGEVVVLADDQGKEVRVPTKDIESNRETALSPMPANFGEVIPEADFFHLMAYLLDQRAKDPPKK